MMMSRFSSPLIIHVPRPGRLSEVFYARRRAPDIDQATLDAILAEYRLELAGGARNLPNTRRNQNLILKTTAGKKMVKRYRRDWRTSTIAFEHSILTRLKEVDFPAPRLVAMPDGGTWLNVDGSNYCLFDFLDGVNYSSYFLLRPQRARMMATSGATLARLHRCLQGFLPSGQHHLGFRDYSGERWHDQAWFTAVVEDYSRRSQDLPDPLQRSHASWLVSQSARILDDIGRLDNALAGVGLPRMIIHGDYGLHNLLYQSLDHAVPVDFELARIEWRLCDIVSVVGKFRHDNGVYDTQNITNFMRAYQCEFPIPDVEWRWMGQVWKYYKLTKAVQYWSSFFETKGPTRKLLSAREEIKQADWALDNFNLLSVYRGTL